MRHVIPIKQTLERIPGGFMVVPLGLGCLVANLAPNVPKSLGSFSGALFATKIGIFTTAEFARKGLPIGLPPVGLPL
jgi:hypothetical protein